MTVNGQNVLNRTGNPIIIPQDATRINVSEDGNIYADGQQIGALQFVQFDDRLAVQKQGDALYYAQEGAAPQPATGAILQGMLERSNVNVVTEMVELINNHRVYEADSKAVVTQDEMTDTAITRVGTGS